MSQYQLGTSNFQSGQVGTVYNVGLSDGTKSYGYLFANQGGQGTGFQEETNVADKEKLIQFSSPNLIDRDLSYYPRVTQGDFSGGGLQTVFLDPTKYFDSDLEVRTPGYLTLRPGWKRVQLASGSTGTYQCVNFNNDIYSCWNTANIYNSAGTTFAPGFNAKLIDTDGSLIYVADGVANISYMISAGTFVSLTTVSGNVAQIWAVYLGTFGRFLFVAPPLTGTIQTLNKLDLSAAPPLTYISVPMGSCVEQILDIQPYQSGIAILTKDSIGGGNADLWFHDGANMTRITRISQYVPVGMANCLGNLYVTAQSQGSYEGPVLLRVASGAVEVVARFATPLATLTAAMIGDPIATGQYVCFALTSPQINNVTTTSYIAVYDTITASITHLGSLDANDNPQVTQPRQLAASGRAVAFPMSTGGNTHLQYQTNTNKLVAGTTYQSPGTVVSSRLDFGTPGIPKRFRRIEIVHSPLAAGESIQVKGFVDLDPLAYTSGLTPTATITNSTLNSALTALTFGGDTVGRTLYYAITLASNGTSTPKVQRVAVEIGGTYTWTFDLDCSSKRRTLQQQTEDQQGVNGKDLYYLLRNAYENGTLLTLYLAQGASYTVTVESLKAKSVAYSDHLQSTVRADQEWSVHAVLKQVA